MKNYNSLAEMKDKVHPSIYYFHVDLIAATSKEHPDTSFDDFTAALGGPVKVIESLEEWLALLETVPSSDSQYFFDNVLQTPDKLFIVAFIAISDLGGPLYYVPIQISKQAGELK